MIPKKLHKVKQFDHKLFDFFVVLSFFDPR